MSHIWTFSPSSEPYLHRIISAATLQETENKWTLKFGRKNTTLLHKSETPEQKSITVETIVISPSPEEQENHAYVNNDDFFESIESEIRLDSLMKKCAENPDILLEMAQRLPLNTVEKLFNRIFTTEDVEIGFLTSIIHKFLPAYIKQQCSWLCIDLLTKINEKYAELFPKLLKLLLEEIETPNKVLSNYVGTLNAENNTNFLKNLSNIEMSSEIFVHHILTIYTAYKNCGKNNAIQEYIKISLLKHSRSCATEKYYGRLFLAYLQSEKSLEHTVNVRQLEECLELHRSPFKRPCVILLKEFVVE